ncbi:hypothetical protein [Sphingomonas sp. UYAg733]
MAKRRKQRRQRATFDITASAVMHPPIATAKPLPVYLRRQSILSQFQLDIAVLADRLKASLATTTSATARPSRPR